MAYEEQAAQYYEDGYFIADDAFDPGMLRWRRLGGR